MRQRKGRKCLAAFLAALTAAAALTVPAAAVGTESTELGTMEWGTMNISGGGFVSGIVTGDTVMYARTDVGGAYKYDFEKERWDQMLGFVTEAERGFLSVDAMCIDPTDENTVYFLCGCAYFSDARTVIYKTTDGGQTFTESDVTDMIQVHGNGDGRHFGEAIAVDPDNPDVIYCGGDVTAGDSCLIWSQDGGETWDYVDGYDDLGFYTNTILWPTWTSHEVRGVTDGAYNTQNGVSSVCIYDGKVYVASSVAASGNVAVAEVGSDSFETLSSSLPTNVYPSRINQDCDGRLLISYVAGVCFGNGSGGVWRYDPATGTAEDISPVNNSIGACQSAPDDPNTLIATTCAVWSSQSWDSETTCWGEWLYRSTDGGETWTSIYPGKMSGIWEWDEEAQEMKQSQLYDYLQSGGCSWIYGKAIHWSGALVVNPMDSSEILVTSGNGVFKWENIWTEDPVAVFHATGIEEVVALDLCSAVDGPVYSAIGDYDGFLHDSVDGYAVQHDLSVEIKSTSGIAVCPQNNQVLARVHEKDSTGYYTLDGGASWTEMTFPNGGGKISIAELASGKYRIFYSFADNATVQYTDDFGGSWSTSSGISGSKTAYTLVDPQDPSIVYAYTAYYNQYYFYSKPAAEFEDAHYTYAVSKDYGATFTSTDLCMYDECDQCGRIAYLGTDQIVVGAGWYGMYKITDGGATATKMNVFYCKSVGYGAPKEEGGLNTLYLYGRPTEQDVEGVYCSVDGGESWICINAEHLYGGTGNGNFIIGDMNTFGTVYMSTVGCGIVYGRLLSDEGGEIITTTTTEAGAEATLYGDANCDNEVKMSDIILMTKVLNDAETLTAQGKINANVNLSAGDENVTASDVSKILTYISGQIQYEDLIPQ